MGVEGQEAAGAAVPATSDGGDDTSGGCVHGTAVRWAGRPDECLADQSLFFPRRLSRVTYGMLLQQQTTMDKIETGELFGQQVFQTAVISQSDDKSAPTVFPGRTDEIEEWPSKGAWAKPPDPSKTAETMTRPSKHLPSTVASTGKGFCPSRGPSRLQKHDLPRVRLCP